MSVFTFPPLGGGSGGGGGGGGLTAGLALIPFEDLQSTSIGSVHSYYSDNEANNTWPGPITQPNHPRRIAVQWSGSYEGGDITVTGLDENGDPAVEVVQTDLAGGSTTPVTFFTAISSITKEFSAGGGASASVSFSPFVKYTPLNSVTVLDGTYPAYYSSFGTVFWGTASIDADTNVADVTNLNLFSDAPLVGILVSVTA